MKPIPDDVLNAMADAMLDPELRMHNVSINKEFRRERIRVLSRAIAAAEELGWIMIKAETDATDRS